MSTYTLSRRKFSAVYAAGASSGTPGTALANGKLWLTVAGGTYNNSADYMAAYTDYTSGTPVTRDGDGAIVLDAAGETEIWYEGLADIRVASSTDELQYTQDNVPHAMPNVVTGSSNILPNGSFEQDSNADGTPDDWSLTQLTGGTIAIDGTSGSSTHGENGLKFTGTGSGAGWATSEYFPVSTKAKMLRLQWEFKQSTASSGSYTIAVFWYQDDSGTASATASTLVWNLTSGAPTTWTQYEAGASVPSDAVWAKLRVTGLGTAGSDKSGDCWFDNIGIYQDNAGHQYPAAVDCNSQASNTYTGIPKWAKEIVIDCLDISTLSTNPVWVRIGNATVWATMTYNGHTITGANTCVEDTYTGTNGVRLAGATAAAAAARTGRIVFSLMDSGETYVMSGTANDTDSADSWAGSGKAVLSTAYADRVEVWSTDTFDGSGKFRVSWKG